MPAKNDIGMADALEHVAMFTPLTVGDAPDDPGLYAWYGVLSASPKDWELELEEGRDRGADACRQLLRRHATRFVSPPIQLKARGAFSSTWSGSLDDTTRQILNEIFGESESGEDVAVADDETDTRGDRARLEAILAEPELRRVLVGTLERAVPLLSAPIYVGVAKSLRVRLGQHADALFTLSAAVTQKPDLQGDFLHVKKQTFATRAVALGFSPENLRVWTLNLRSFESGTDTQNLRDIAETAEWFLNRWGRPLLGRK